MKKLTALLLTLMLALSLTACGGEEEAAEAAAEESVEEAAAEGEAAEEVLFDTAEMVGSWELSGCVSADGTDIYEEALETFFGEFSMDIREDGTVSWYMGDGIVAEGGIVEIEDDGSAMMEFVNGDAVMNFAAGAENGELALIDADGNIYTLISK